MAVKIDIETSLPDLMGKLGCDHQLITAAVGAHLTCTYTMDGVCVQYTDSTPIKDSAAGGALAKGLNMTAPIKLGALQSILAGTLPGGVAKNLAKIGLEKVVKSMLLNTSVKVGDPPFIKSSEEMLGDKMYPKMEDMVQGEVPPTLSQAEVAEIFKGVDVGGDDQSSVLKKPAPSKQKVHLSSASALNQPVFGSDASSVYHTVAISPGIKVAARIKVPQHVSIRAEGPLLSHYHDGLAKAGLTNHGKYSSVHLSCSSPELMKKCIGAVLMCIGVQFENVMTDLTQIWNKGT